jgi:hypothetical protein
VNLAGTNSAMLDSEISHVGCNGMSATGGDPKTLAPGNITVRGNTIHHIGLWKRTYMPAIAFGGR